VHTAKTYAAVLLLIIFSCVSAAVAEKAGSAPGTKSGAGSKNDHSASKTVNGGSKIEVRVLHFPSDKSMGTILLGKNEVRGEFYKKIQVAGAAGDVKVEVPPGYFILFEANRRVFEHPESVDRIPKEGVDRLKIGSIAMTDGEEGLCDKALSHVPSITGLKGLDVDRSDATDKGLSCVKFLKNLERVNCLHSDVSGAFFKDLIGLPHFDYLDCSWCAIDEANLKFLPSLKHLETLNMARTGLTDSALIELAKCENLRELHIGSNPKLTDGGMKALLPMKNLRYLDVRKTKLTLRGLRNIAGVKLYFLGVPQSLSQQTNLKELMKVFPGVQLFLENNEVPDEIRKTYAPIKWGAEGK
jgi:hypothetical protein